MSGRAASSPPVWLLRGFKALWYQAAIISVIALSVSAIEEFNLGFYGPITSVDQVFLSIIVAADLDLRKHFEPPLVQRFGPPLVNISNIAPNLRFKVQTCDSNSDTAIGMRCGLNFFSGQNGYSPIGALVGGYHSAISTPVASLATLYKITQVSWASTSPALSNKKNYPFFLRTIPPDSVQGAGMWRFIEHFLISSVAFLNSQEPYGAGLLSAVSEQAANAEQGFRISAFSIVYMPGAGNYDPEEARSKVTLAKRTGLKFWFLAMGDDQFRGLAPVLREEGLLNGQYQFIGSEAVTYSAAPDVLPVGHIWFAPISRGAVWPAFEEMYRKMVLDDVLSPANRARYTVGNYEVPFDEATGGLLTSSVLANPEALPLEAPFIFDAAYTFFVAVNELLLQGVALQDIKDEVLLNKVRGVSFEGISGMVAFDKNGDRAASYQIQNAQPGPSGIQAVVTAVYSASTGIITPEEGVDLYWMVGATSWSIPEALASCDPGFWKDPDTRLCIECEPGTISAGGVVTQCQPCEAGKMADAPRMATQCLNCTAGTFSKESKSTECASCPPGQFGDEIAATACVQCTVGAFSNSSGSTKCELCAEGKQRPDLYGTLQQVDVLGVSEWVPFAGAKTASACGCLKGAYSEQGECQLCGKGMRCDGMGEVLIMPYYFASADDPGFVFACFGNDHTRCPGGAPGTCAAGRDVTSLTCQACLPNMKHGDNGECVECGGVDVLPLLIAIVLGGLLLLTVYRVIDTSKPAAQTKSVLLVAIAGSQMVTMFQQLSVFGTISLEWSAPFSNVLEFVSLFNFKLDYLALDCVAAVPPLQKFGLRVFMVLLFFAFMVLVHVVSVIVLHKRQFRARMPALIGAVGTVFSAFFISIVSSMLAPFQCNVHPNGLRTMVDYPSVVCWDDSPYGDGGHAEMVTLAAVANLIPLVFLGGTCWVIWRLPGKLASGDTEFLNSFKFLFFRFRAGAHWYVVVFLVRNLLVAIVPVLGSEVVQLLLLESIMLPMLILTVHVMPWSVATANVLDASNTMFLAVLLFAFALFTEEVGAKLIAEVCVALVIGAFAGILVALVYGVYERFLRSGKPYQFFLCHHKAGAGNLARLLKMSLQPQVAKKVFVDSDDLRDLTQLFGVVSSDTETLVVLCSKEILSRPWCMGEVTSANCNHVSVVKIVLSDFRRPDEHFIDNYEQHVPDAVMLSQHGISVDLIKESLHWLCTRPEIEVRGQMCATTLTGVSRCLLGGLSGDKVVIDSERVVRDDDDAEGARSMPKRWRSQAVPMDKDNYILANMANLESAAAAFVLSRLLAPLMQHLPEQIPQVLQDDQVLPATAKQLCLICDNGVFTSMQVVRTLVLAAEGRLGVLPVVAEASFRFPSKEFLVSLAKQTNDVLHHMGSEYKGVAFARIVDNIFKEIAVEVNPQDAEAALQVRAQAVYTRLHGRVRGLQVSMQEADDDRRQAELCGDYVAQDEHEPEPVKTGAPRAGRQSMLYVEAAQVDYELEAWEEASRPTTQLDDNGVEVARHIMEKHVQDFVWDHGNALEDSEFEFNNFEGVVL